MLHGEFPSTKVSQKPQLIKTAILIFPAQLLFARGTNISSSGSSYVFTLRELSLREMSFVQTFMLFDCLSVPKLISLNSILHAKFYSQQLFTEGV